MCHRTYESFDILQVARDGMNYITSMVDPMHDYLPYWRVQIDEVPAFAMHTKVDDSEIVASWYEAITALEKIIGATPKSTEVRQGFKRHMLKSWGEDGLRYHEPYPWSSAIHASFHELGWVMSGMNRLLLEEPDNKQAEALSANCVKAMRRLVHHRRIRTFWAGESLFDEKVYEFPGDVYMKGQGFVPERVAGRGEPSIRNAVVLEPLVTRARLFGDEEALDLAEGVANFMLGIARYFNWKGEFFGHVHSAVWFAIGLIKLGRLMGRPHYIEKSVQIFEYVRSISSEFGWVPEYGQWFPASETDCETCCIKDMIEFALEANEIGYDYWDLVNKYTRNQLVEQQIRHGGFVSVEDRDDEPGYTWRDLDKRIVGGWSGGGEPNCVSLTRFRSIAGCCVGTAPVALWQVYEKIVEEKPDGVHVQLPMTVDRPQATVVAGYPNDGRIEITAKRSGDYHIRTYAWMGDSVSIARNGVAQPIIRTTGGLTVPGVQPGDRIVLSHDLHEVVKEQVVRGQSLRVFWRGPDVVRMDPPGLPLRLYQREIGVPKVYPKPQPVVQRGSKPKPFILKPTEQKK
jgi:hypothetical protein